jgi:hypothetical protein
LKAAQPKAKSAYNYFVKESHQKLKDEKSSLSMSEKTKKIGVDWKAMSSEQKKPYEDLAAADKVIASVFVCVILTLLLG